MTTTLAAVALNPKLAKRLAVEAAKAASHTAERNRLIVEASQAGASLREIGRVVGLTHVAVKKIIDRY